MCLSNLRMFAVKSKNVILTMKILFALVILAGVSIHQYDEIERAGHEQSQKDFREFEARQDALEDELRPLIERNKKINAAAGIDVDSEN